MTQLKGQAELDSFKLTKKEIADYLGISTNAVRMSMRGSNYHNLEYRKGPKGFLFKVPTRPGDIIVDSTTVNHGAISTPGITPRSSKVINRGATHRGEAKYTSLALQMANEARTVAAIDNKFVDAAHKKAFMEMTEAGFELALKNSRATKERDTKVMLNKSYSQDNSHVVNPRSHGKYGGMLNGQGLRNIEDQHHGKLARKNERDNGTKYVEELVKTTDFNGQSKMEYKRTNTPDFGRGADTSFYSGRSYYDGGSQREEYVVEFSHAELNRNSRPTERTEFKNKIDEDIYRAKKHLLKTRGTY